MDRQTLRDWVHRFNVAGPEGLFDHWTGGPKSRLSAEQLGELAKIVEAGPDCERDGVVRWLRVDLKHMVKDRFGVDFTVLCRGAPEEARILPRHPGQDRGARWLSCEATSIALKIPKEPGVTLR